MNAVDEDVGCLEVAVNDSWLVVVQVVESRENLNNVASNDVLVERAESLALALQGVRHQLHEDLGLFVLNHAPVVLDDVLVGEATQQLALVLQLLQKISILRLHHLQSHLRRKRDLTRGVAPLTSLIQALVHDSERALAQFLALGDRLQLFLPLLVDFNLVRVIEAPIVAVDVFDVLSRVAKP